MLQFKIKETLYLKGKQYPHAWLKKVTGLTANAATSLLNRRQKSIRLKDISAICYALQCTPNDLLFWEEDKKTIVNDEHPLKAELSPPPAETNWQRLFLDMDSEDMEEFYNLVQEKLKAKKAAREKKRNAAK